jgi:glyoxylase-like metal-dependent hydrolase (beta-lactamase superfamily II)
MFKVGQASIKSVLELTLHARPISWLTEDTDLIDANRWWMTPHFLEPGERWSLNFQSWIVHVDDRIVVIDPCNGNDRSHEAPIFDNLQTPFLERFEATGIRVEDVDVVFCTHLHHDHCGWNTRLRNDVWVPTFPNARYIFSKREYDRWNPKNVGHFTHQSYNDGVFERSIAPIVKAGLAHLLTGPENLTPSLCTQAGAGHTFGHTMLHLISDNEEAMFSGDAFHHPLQLIDPSIRFGDHDDWNAVTETRRRLVHNSITRNMLLIPAHLPSPHAGWMKKDDGNRLYFHKLGKICTEE